MTGTETEHMYNSECFCDDCERIGNEIASDKRAEEREIEKERHARSNQHPTVWH